VTKFDRVVEGFLAAYPHWNEFEARKLTNSLTRRFKKQMQLDSNYVLHLVAELWEYTGDYCQRRGKTPEQIRPGFVRNAALGQKRFWTIKGVNISEVFIDDNLKAVERFNFLKENMTSSLKVFQEPFSRDNISFFFKQLRNCVELTPRENDLFQTIEDVAEFESNFDELWDEVEIRFFEDDLLNITKANFSQIKSRLLQKVKAAEPNTIGGLMHFIPRVPAELKLFIKVLDGFDVNFNNQ
jgi:hypothetical protein